MSDKIIIRYLSGSKINQVDEYPLSDFDMLTFGRDEHVDVRFDPDKDDLVSRKHAVIKRNDGNRFSISDENSRNGTFVNKQRISGTFAVSHGDVIQFGAGGPEFQFELDPPPKAVPPPTREASSYFQSKETRAASSITGADEVSSPSTDTPPPLSSSRSAGRVTMLQKGIEAYKNQSRQTMLSIGAGLLGLIILISGLFFYLNTKTVKKPELSNIGDLIYNIEKKDASKMEAKEIAAKYSDAVVMIDVDWKLTHIESNKQVYHRRINARYPLYLKLGNQIIPWLTTDDEKGTNIAVGSEGWGTGFVVSRLGFILTNRHVAAGDTTSYDNFPRETSYVYPVKNIGGSDRNLYVVDVRRPQKVASYKLMNMLGSLQWIPEKESIVVNKRKGQFVLDSRDNQYESRNTLNVFFPFSNNPTPAELVRKSIKHDVALIKIAAMEGLPEVILEEERNKPEMGEEITILGYPGVSPDVTVKTESVNPFDSASSTIKVPSPTLTTGNIGKLISSKMLFIDQSIEKIYSNVGDVYQLTANATGTGNSGGPVFNEQGRVIGIFFASRRMGGASVTFAIPISYGIEIMSGYKPVVR